jgi:NarL family two-component system response regulator LiaR
LETLVSGGSVYLFEQYPQKKKIRVLIVDDHPVARKELRTLLEDRGGMRVVAEARNSREAFDLFNTLKPDVVLMDLVLPEVDGIEAIRRITSEHPNSKILLFSDETTDERVFPARMQGALSFFEKKGDPGKVIEAIQNTFHTKSSFEPVLARSVLGDDMDPPKIQPGAQKLTEREMEVLKLLACGYDNPEIAKQLFVAEVTVRTHISRILDKLHLANRVQATLFALREGISSLEMG